MTTRRVLQGDQSLQQPSTHHIVTLLAGTFVPLAVDVRQPHIPFRLSRECFDGRHLVGVSPKKMVDAYTIPGHFGASSSHLFRQSFQLFIGFERLLGRPFFRQVMCDSAEPIGPLFTIPFFVPFLGDFQRIVVTGIAYITIVNECPCLFGQLDVVSRDHPHRFVAPIVLLGLRERA